MVLDFMAALSDPRGFLGAADKRMDNMKNLGIEDAGGLGDCKEEKKEAKKEGTCTNFKDIKDKF